MRIVGESGVFDDVRVDHRGALSAVPAYFIDPHDTTRSTSGRGRRVAITRVEGPWPVGGPRAYMRVLLEDGRNVLLVWQGGEWAMEGLTQ